jgi:hypothetical protein
MNNADKQLVISIVCDTQIDDLRNLSLVFEQIWPPFCMFFVDSAAQWRQTQCFFE